ncbi:MAG TPA: CHC2 zinc finger domain-containing protein, partial [Elusimicrobiota bacterium]|nr:CHC2 zinc finger domain-containing protein [Elusimicrobiota bacterium]
MRIGDSQLEDIRQRVDVVELVREFVPALKQAGRNFKACCPFHQEKTPSFMVNPERQIYHCFGCQAGGDVFAFVMQMEGLSFPEAARKLAERAGVKLEEERSASPEERDRAKLKAALVFAREYYREQLLKSPEAEPARAYLQKRGVNAEASEKFGLGYAPRSGGLIAAAAKKGFDAALLSRTGLAAQRQGQGTYRDYFWGRILYPIQNIKGE